jgi:hypothetical protein
MNCRVYPVALPISAYVNSLDLANRAIGECFLMVMNMLCRRVAVKGRVGKNRLPHQKETGMQGKVLKQQLIYECSRSSFDCEVKERLYHGWQPAGDVTIVVTQDGDLEQRDFYQLWTKSEEVRERPSTSGTNWDLERKRIHKYPLTESTGDGE